MINFDGFFHYCAGGPNIFTLIPQHYNLTLFISS